MELGKEIAYFNRNRAQWITDDHEGDWVVVRAEEHLGFFSTFQAAFEAGAKKYGKSEFLVKQVTAQDDVETVQRVHWGGKGCGRTATV